MKKFFVYIIIIVLNFSCNDGNLKVQDISFDNVTGSNCGNLSYKIKGNQVLIIKFDDITKVYKPDQTLTNAPLTFPISSVNPVTYRVYSGVPSSVNFCSTPVPPATPIVVEEWIATSGSIEVTSTVSRSTNATTNATTITGYNNFVQLKNVTFKKPNGDQFYETFSFGNISVAITPLNITFPDDIKQCATPKILTSKIGSVALMSFDNLDNLIQNIATNTGNPRVSVINSTTNKLLYRTFSVLDLNNYLCKTTFTPADTMLQEWKAISGKVEVETTQTGALFTHKVTLKNVKLVWNNSDFYLGDKFELGKLETN